MSIRETGIFYLHAASEEPLKQFPKEYRRRLLSSLDRNFAMLLGICAVTMGGLTFAFSIRDLPAVASDREIQKIQERYAQLVLNQPKPKPKKEEKRGRSRAEKAEEDEKEKIDRKKETFAEKEQRREQSREDRQRRRDEISKELQSAGIFAAITAVGGSSSGPSSGVSDLLGATDAVSGLEGISLSQGTFATRNVDASQLTGRRGERTTGVALEKQNIGTANTRRIASAGNVKISSEPPKISGDEEQVQGSQRCIQAVINREKTRIKRVYETWLKRDPKLGGRLKISFRILETGAVSGAMVMHSTTNNSSFDQNIIRYVNRWNFARCSPGSPLDIELPVVFEGQA